LDIFVVICFVMVFLAFVEFAFISFVGIFISRMKYRDFVRVRTLRQMTRYTVKKRLTISPSLAEISLTKLSLAGNN
jgi:hypothetical protein